MKINEALIDGYTCEFKTIRIDKLQNILDKLDPEHYICVETGARTGNIAVYRNISKKDKVFRMVGVINLLHDTYEDLTLDF